jgi:hypothetical protein
MTTFNASTNLHLAVSLRDTRRMSLRRKKSRPNLVRHTATYSNMTVAPMTY